MESTLDKLKNLLSPIIDFCFVIFPTLGYIHQYIKIYKLKNSEGFSKFISFVLIIAYNIRIFFWIGDRFETSIILQAVLGFIMQIILLQLCVKYDKTTNSKLNLNYFSYNLFWNWPFFMDYIYFISFITIFLSLISNLIGYDNKSYMFILGLFSGVIEAMLDIPQIIELYKTKNPKTISYLLVFSWLGGDIFKFSYYAYKNAPFQFIGCALFQLCTDIFVVFQLWYYTKHYHNEIVPISVSDTVRNVPSSINNMTKTEINK